MDFGGNRTCTGMIAAAFVFLCLSNAWALTIRDQAGRYVNVPDSPKRVVSLIPNITEIIFLLGRGGLVVGTPEYSNRPKAAERIDRIGSYAHPDIEHIVALEPDICFASSDGNPILVVNRLDSMHIPVLVIDPRDIEGIQESVLLLGRVLDATGRARKIVDWMEDVCTCVDNQVRRTRDRPRVFFQIETSPIISAGTDTFIDRLITRAGGLNLAAGSSLYPIFSLEEILAMNPEVVLIASMAGGYTEDVLLSQWTKWPEMSAVKSGMIYVIDADLFDRPVPRIVEGLERMFCLIHPERAESMAECRKIRLDVGYR